MTNNQCGTHLNRFSDPNYLETIPHMPVFEIPPKHSFPHPFSTRTPQGCALIDLGHISIGSPSQITWETIPHTPFFNNKKSSPHFHTPIHPFVLGRSD